MMIVIAGLPLKCTIKIRFDIFPVEPSNAENRGFIGSPTPPCPSGVAEEYSKHHVESFHALQYVLTCPCVCQRCS
jgi:hypothetical protein